MSHSGIAPQENGSRRNQHNQADADTKDGARQVTQSDGDGHPPGTSQPGSSNNRKGLFRESRPIEDSLPRKGEEAIPRARRQFSRSATDRRSVLPSRPTRQQDCQLNRKARAAGSYLAAMCTKQK